MVELLNAGSEDFKWWIDGRHILTHRRGLLWKYLESTDPDNMTRKQLASRVKAWAPVMHHHKNLEAVYNNTTGSRRASDGGTFEEFDVIKKRRQMTDSTSIGENDSVALRQFEEFEASVLDALTGISQDYQQQRYEEFLEAEMDLWNGTSPQKGMFYVAVNRAVMRGGKLIPKLGGTRKSDPMIRLKQLSRSVPDPFQLVFCIASFTPFKVEAEVHRHFDAHRIRERRGACTEFFEVDLETIGQYLRTKYPGEVIDGDYSCQDSLQADTLVIGIDEPLGAYMSSGERWA